RHRSQDDAIARTAIDRHLRERQPALTRAQREDAMAVLVPERERRRHLSRDSEEFDPEGAAALLEPRALLRPDARDERGVRPETRGRRRGVRDRATEAPVLLAGKDVARHMTDGEEARHAQVTR